MNLLILSPGRRCELIRYFKDELNKYSGKLIAADISEYAPALYFADKYYVLKQKIQLDRYIEEILLICYKEQVDYLLPYIDPELELISKYQYLFKKHNITILLSEKHNIETTYNKKLFYTTYKDDLNLVETFSDYNELTNRIRGKEIEFPIIAKELKGSASSGFHQINSVSELEKVKDRKNYIFQQYITGDEFGADVYIDFVSEKIVSVFIKKKIAMRAGETDKSLSVFREDLLKEIFKIEKCGGFKGPLDVDLFDSGSGKIFINEINPRFGGGYPHAHFCGVNFVKLMVNNMLGIENKKNIGNYKINVKMMKYNGLLFEHNGETYEG